VAKQLLIEVCGLETLVLKSSDIYKKIVGPTSGNNEIISTTVSTGWFTLSKTAINSDCEVTSYRLYSDSIATTSWSNAKVSQDATAVNYNYDIRITKETFAL
jgi:hypothetical protein